MKAIFLALLLVFCLTGCMAKDGPSQQQPPPQQSEEPPSPQETDRPTDEQVMAAFQQATEAMEWVRLTTMPLYEENGVEMEYSPAPGESYPVTYYPVNHPTIGTAQELWDYLGTLFSPEIVSQLQTESQDRYRDMDGVLYAFAVNRNRNLERGEATYQVVEQDGGLAVQATVTTLSNQENQNVYAPTGGSEVLTFPYRNVNGHWVFTEFDLIW